MNAKEYIKKVTGIEIKSDMVHLYNIEAKDLVLWLNEFANSHARELAVEFHIGMTGDYSERNKEYVERQYKRYAESLSNKTKEEEK